MSRKEATIQLKLQHVKSALKEAEVLLQSNLYNGAVICHNIGTQHSSLTQPMTLPTLPHAIFSTLQGTQCPHTEANLAKS